MSSNLFHHLRNTQIGNKTLLISCRVTRVKIEFGTSGCITGSRRRINLSGFRNLTGLLLKGTKAFDVDWAK